MATEVYGGLPFEEAITFFRGKVNVPSDRWADVWQEEHDTAFMVASATKAELLADLRAAVDKAITQGTTLAEFRKDFDAAVERHGWTYRGGRAWRTEVIYKTNLRTAYAAGRFEQMTHPDVLIDRPYWMYEHGDSIHPRRLHLSWHGKVLLASDPWWKTHYTPNGWGCNCKTFSLSQDDLEAMGKAGPDEAPKDGERAWTDPVTGEVHMVPNGIDPGWAYTPGRSTRAAKLFLDKTAALPADLGAAMMEEALPSVLPRLRTEFDAWAGEVFRSGQAKGEGRIVGAMSPTTVGYLSRIGKMPMRAAILVQDEDLLHMNRAVKVARGKAIPEETLRKMPELFAAPKAVLWDKTDDALLYVFDEPTAPESGKLVVGLNFRVKERVPDPALAGGQKRVKIVVNKVRSGGLVSRQTLRDTNTYEVIEGAL